MKLCTVPDCARAHFARGYCQPHYDKARQRGMRNELISRPLPGVAMRPLLPARITKRLHALAESSPSPTEYEARKAEILAGNS